MTKKRPTRTKKRPPSSGTSVDALALKVEALCWLRFTKHLPYVCTEVGPWSADVVGMNSKFSVEVEVKTSKADLRREFSTKKAKHYLYANADGEAGLSTPPNYFYFLVPKDLQEYACETVAQLAPKAGVAVYDPDGLGLHRDGDKTFVARAPTRLHAKPPGDEFKRTMLKRMGSELCARYVTHRKYLAEVVEKLQALDDAIVTTVKELAQTKDLEEAHGDPQASA